MDILLKQSKRQKITLTTFFAYGFIGLMILYQPQNAVLLLFCLIVGVLIWWSLELGLDYKNVPFVYCMPISWVLISYIFLATIQNQIITLMILIVFAILFHMLLLTLNLLVISNIKNIPLKSAALSTIFLLGLLLIAMTIGIVIGFEITIYGQLGLIMFSIIIVGLTYLYSFNAGSIMIEIIAFIIMILPITLCVYFGAINRVVSIGVLTGWVGLLMGVLGHQVEKDISNKLIREYTFIGIALVLIFLFVS